MCRTTFFFSKAVSEEKWTGVQEGRAVIKGQAASLMAPFGFSGDLQIT